MQTEDNYPTIGDRLTFHHEALREISINTEIIEYKHLELAICRATIKTPKGTFTGSGVSSKDKDPDYIQSLLEVAETRAVSRALRFSGACVDKTGREEIAKATQSAPSYSSAKPITNGQKRLIERIAKEHNWDLNKAVGRILGSKSIETLNDLNNQEASTVIQRMKAVLVA